MKLFKILLWAVIILFIGCFVVVNVWRAPEPGKAYGVADYGVVRDKSYENQWMFAPSVWSKVYPFDVTEQASSFSWEMKTGNVQSITMKGTINYALNPQEVHRVLKNIGEGNKYKSVLVDPLLQGTISQLVGKQDPIYVVNSQDVVAEAVRYIVADQLAQTGLVFVNGVQIFAPKFDKDLEKAFKDVAVAKLATQRVEEEAKQMLMKAEAEGKALQIKSEALRNPLIVQYEVAKALGSWKGNLPSTLVLGQGALPILSGK